MSRADTGLRDRMRPSRHDWLWAGLLAGVIAAGSGTAVAAEGIFMVPHRAIYEMTLAGTRSGSNVTQVSGRMVYELVGSVCDGYTQNMRFVTQMTSESGTVTLSDLRSSSWEEGTGRRFRFNSSQYRDEKPTEATAGDASRAPGADIKVELSKPARRDIALSPGTYFPVQHSIALIKAAREGKTMFRADLYDGSEKGEKVYDTVSVIGQAVTEASTPDKPLTGKNSERLAGVPTWPVSIAYYEPNSDKKDAVPVYELSFLFLDNGVSRNLLIDYGEFAIQGDLKEITFLEPSKCDKPAP